MLKTLGIMSLTAVALFDLLLFAASPPVGIIFGLLTLLGWFGIWSATGAQREEKRKQEEDRKEEEQEEKRRREEEKRKHFEQKRKEEKRRQELCEQWKAMSTAEKATSVVGTFAVGTAVVGGTVVAGAAGLVLGVVAIPFLVVYAIGSAVSEN